MTEMRLGRDIVYQVIAAASGAALENDDALQIERLAELQECYFRLRNEGLRPTLFESMPEPFREKILNSGNSPDGLDYQTLMRQDFYTRRGRLPFTPTEHRFFAYLVANSGQLVTRDAISELIWHGKYSSKYQRALTLHVKRMREKLSTPESSVIQTARGRGYVFNDPDGLIQSRPYSR